MKLAPVLAKYLTANKVLRLPGLGVFHAENAYDPDVDYSKKGASLLNISFEQAKVTELDETLIDFVASETGKMKVLSKSDLLSEIDAVINFLNTGKPYFLSGIGTITKKFDGSFEFHKEKYHHSEREKKKKVPITEKNSVPQAYIDETRRPHKTRPAIIILTLCILAIAATVLFYIRNSENNAGTLEEVTADTLLPEENTGKDTVAAKPTAASFSGSYKFVLEIAGQPRAFKRYNQLKKINWPVELETADSVTYKLFIPLPMANTDTVKVKDSLSRLSGRKVWIER
ncbi:MAG: hypothetical protein QM594_03485 [Niabella sp.]